MINSRQLFRQPQIIVQTWKSLSKHSQSITEREVRQNLHAIEALWDNLFHNEQARLLQLFIEHIDINTDEVSIKIRSNGVDDLVQSIQKLKCQNQESIS